MNRVAPLALFLALGLAAPVVLAQAATSDRQKDIEAKQSQAEKDKHQAEEKFKLQQEFAQKELEEAKKRAQSGQGPVGQPGVAPAFKFETPVLDLGKVSDDAVLPVRWKFTNTSDKPVKINNVSASCGCTTIKPSKDTYAPGEGGVIEASFNPQNRRGKEVKHVYVDTDFSASPRMELTFSVETLPRVLVEPMSLFLGEKRKGEAASQILSVTGREPGFDVTDARFSDGTTNFVLRRLDRTETKADDGATLTKVQYQVELTGGLPLGNYRSVIQLTTNDAKKANLPVQLAASVVGDLRLVPDRVHLVATQTGQGWVREIRVDHRRMESFLIDSIGLEGVNPELKAIVDIQPGTPNPQLGQTAGYVIRLSGVTPDKPGPVMGKIVIKTRIPDQETIEIPLQGNIVISGQQAPNLTPTGKPAIMPSPTAGQPPANKK